MVCFPILFCFYFLRVIPGYLRRHLVRAQAAGHLAAAVQAAGGKAVEGPEAEHPATMRAWLIVENEPMLATIAAKRSCDIDDLAYRAVRLSF